MIQLYNHVAVYISFKASIILEFDHLVTCNLKEDHMLAQIHV